MNKNWDPTWNVPFPVMDGDDDDGVYLYHVRERVSRHRLGLPVADYLSDFEAHAADDIEFLLELLAYANNQIAEAQEELNSKRDLDISQALGLAKEADDKLDSAVSSLMYAEGWLRKSKEQLRLLRDDPSAQLITTQKELEDTRIQLINDKRTIASLKLKLAEAEKRLADLPPTWLERLKA
jgi:hypothetical protein